MTGTRDCDGFWTNENFQFPKNGICLQEKQEAGDKSAGNENAIMEVFHRNLIHLGPECFMTGHHQADQPTQFFKKFQTTLRRRDIQLMRATSYARLRVGAAFRHLLDYDQELKAMVAVISHPFPH